MPCFDLTMTHQGWNAFQAALHQAFPHPTAGVSCLYGQRAQDGAWVRILRTQSNNIVNRWCDTTPSGGHRGSFNQTNRVIPTPTDPPHEYDFLNWTCFFWQLTRLSGQQPVAPYINMPHADRFVNTQDDHLAHFPACEAWRATLPTNYFNPIFRVCVHAAGSPACNDRAIAELPSMWDDPPATRRHLDVRQKCNAWINAHPGFIPPE